ncbi:hypothetical protein ANCDUO_03925 [Ancylostoma duodenale]|uniref:Uncharacterized protein n=1 Tax=Ancylostoma duodenale TaxID=51022 RepID=A0A0C2H8C2_9BILA|nr:hypothetical protein ANCDUO_03925 [Ancylostoma duodenale]
MYSKQMTILHYRNPVLQTAKKAPPLIMFSFMERATVRHKSDLANSFAEMDPSQGEDVLFPFKADLLGDALKV